MTDKLIQRARLSMTVCVLVVLGQGTGCALLNSFDEETPAESRAGDVTDSGVTPDAGVPQEDAGETDTQAPLDASSDAHSDATPDAVGDVEAPDDFAQLCAGVGYLGSDGACVSARSIASGTRHSCALMSDQSVWCWGDNEYGQLGRPADAALDDYVARKVRILSPAQVDLTHQVLSISAGAHHTCAVVNVPPTGRLQAYYCWGSNEFGQLGTGELPGEAPTQSTTVYAPQPVALDRVNAEVAGRIVAGKKSTCATFTPNPDIEDIRCWGANEFGQMGYGGDPNLKPPNGEGWGINPQPVWPVLDIYGKWMRARQFSLHSEHVCLVGAREVGGEYVDVGHLWCWGRNNNRQGYVRQGADPNGLMSAIDLEFANALRPWLTEDPELTAQTEFEEVVTGRAHTCLRVRVTLSADDDPDPQPEASSRIFCWGSNDFQQTQRTNGQQNLNEISMPPSASPVGNIAAGDDFSCAIVGEEAQILCWGDNRSRQLGLENTAVFNADMGTHVHDAQAPLAGVRLVSAGAVHACALRATTLGADAHDVNQVLCWGSNQYGQLARSPRNPSDGCNEANMYYDCAASAQPVQFSVGDAD